MSGVLRGEDAERVSRTLDWPPLHRATSDQPIGDPEIAALTRRVSELTATIERQAEDHKSALANTRREAADEARRQFERDETRAFEALDIALQHASAAHDQALTDLERLAPAMCEIVLEKIFGDVEKDRERITAAIAKQVASLRRESATSIIVSAADFSDEAALAALQQRLPSLTVRAASDLARGECRIGLTLGHVELSIEAFRAAVTAQLREWASL